MNKWFSLVVLILAIAATLSLFPAEAVPAQEPTPTSPAPTWTPGPAATKTPIPTASPPTPPPAARPAPAGAQIELRVQFPPTWPWTKSHWQELWTVVQWQDTWGDWHDVEGWQGALDDVEIGEGGEVVGQKVWWVAESDLGKGPFRWRVYQGWRLLAQSGTFDLPDSNGATVMVEVSLVP